MPWVESDSLAGHERSSSSSLTSFLLTPSCVWPPSPRTSFQNAHVCALIVGDPFFMCLPFFPFPMPSKCLSVCSSARTPGFLKIQSQRSAMKVHSKKHKAATTGQHPRRAVESSSTQQLKKANHCSHRDMPSLKCTSKLLACDFDREHGPTVATLNHLNFSLLSTKIFQLYYTHLTNAEFLIYAFPPENSVMATQGLYDQGYLCI